MQSVYTILLLIVSKLAFLDMRLVWSFEDEATIQLV